MCTHARTHAHTLRTLTQPHASVGTRRRVHTHSTRIHDNGMHTDTHLSGARRPHLQVPFLFAPGAARFAHTGALLCPLCVRPRESLRRRV